MIARFIDKKVAAYGKKRTEDPRKDPEGHWRPLKISLSMRILKKTLSL